MLTERLDTNRTVRNDQAMPSPVPVRERTRREIVAQALTLFSRRGYDAVSLQDIATEVGCTKATVLYHFGDKAGVFAEASRPAVDALTDLVVRLRAQAPGERQAFGVATLAELAVASRELVAILPELFPSRGARTETAHLVAVGQELTALLVDRDDVDSAASVSFALVSLGPFCRESAELDDAELRRTIEVALTRLMLPHRYA